VIDDRQSQVIPCFVLGPKERLSGRENTGVRYRLAAAMQAGITRDLWTMDRLHDEVTA